MIEGMKERFASIRKEHGLNVKEFAKSLDMEPTTVSSIESGRREPSKEVLLNLAVKYAYSLNWIFTGVGEKRLGKALVPAQVHRPLKLYRPSDLSEGSFVGPLLDQSLSAGSGAVLPEADETRALIRVPGYLTQYGENIAALTVDGDSMEPTLRRGDMVVCDSLGWSGEGVYAVRMGGSGFVKRLTKAPGKVVIISDNPKYPVREEPEESEDLQVIGRVHCAITKVE
jgi:phage repressor protein C with HTH and peptisase S24 domain